MVSRNQYLSSEVGIHPGLGSLPKCSTEVWSLKGFSTIATGISFPVQSEFPKLKQYSNGVVKLKVVLKLAAKNVSIFKVIDKVGTSVFINAEYLNLPHKCGTFSEFGHSELRCPKRHTSEKTFVQP
ncbi:unnamed protein product [Eruca vesicaria subsp. sativa]|uniref:DUF4283 domain-containing protein n=1 Tax=Eruca vesicaria subsp. sativa TaxID=29727 RepID=A0ABC8KX58_ERUVS|nr:unnamed protein product [Eruca vesicaria subsp. sativa]